MVLASLISCLDCGQPLYALGDGDLRYLGGHVHGAFAGGAIRYERLTVPNMLAELPPALQVARTQPLNIFHAAAPDRLAARLPGAYWLARMAAISGRKSGDGHGS